jgi:alkylation response protein AidB-like acyl-CoA dehydrogenase
MVETGNAAIEVRRWENDELRARLREFLRDRHPGAQPRDPGERLAWSRAWARTLVEHRFAGPAWPYRWGGMELPLEKQVIYHEEMTRARVPLHPNRTLMLVGPTILQHGTDGQRERYLLKMLAADELWCQGFSEPQAGSDLPALTTRAVRDGDCYVVNGQKVWTSGAAEADWCFALVRTGTQQSRQKGISYLLIGMRSPGVDVRPLRDMTGTARFAELFFTDVRVPVSNLVGVEDEGWRIARTTLGHERSTASIAHAYRYRRIVNELHELARATGAAKDPLLRQELAQVEILARIHTANGERILQGVLLTSDVGPVSSVHRLYTALFEQKLHEVAMKILGNYGLLGKDERALERGRWVDGFLHTRASTIGAGTSEIQRNTLAEQVLGLPFDPAMPPR